MSERMRPLRELEDERLAGVEGLVFDVDDTLTRGGRLEREAFDALHALSDAGVGLWAITGRPVGWAQVFAAQWPVEGAIGENGAGWWWREGEALRRGYFEPDESVREEQRSRLERILHRVRRELPGVRLASDQGLRAHDLAWDVGEEDHLDAATVTALMVLIEEEGAHALVSSVHCHAVPGSWTKIAGAERALAAVRGTDAETLRSRWAFVGDSANDAAAFAGFPLSIGVANVAEHLGRIPQPPAFVTEADRGRGFAELAARLLAARGAR